MADLVLGCCLNEEEKLARRRSRLIDKELKREKPHYMRTVKILLLGSGESGKSTFLKQMRIIHGKDFQEDELMTYKPIVYSNILKGMKVLIDARAKLHIPWADDTNEKYANMVFSIDNRLKPDDATFLNYTPYIKMLWNDKGIKEAFDRRREFQLGDSIEYFLDNLKRVGAPGYVPTKLDMLHSRKATRGIATYDIHIRSVPFQFVDVGGQRTERMKWGQCFDGITSILFLVASSEFDQVLLEDRKTNRLLESCEIFQTIVNHRSFTRVSVILFLNKTDLLEAKVSHISIKDYFPQFTGNPHCLSDVQEFELELFEEMRKEKYPPLFHHYTTAIDTENIKYVFQAVKDTILHDNLKSLMLQ